jgi:hypothetical protein
MSQRHQTVTDSAIIPGQHGGHRPGAGRKKADPSKADAYAVLAQAKAKRETYRAHLAEVEYRVKAGELYDRGEVLRVISVAVAVFAEQMRGLPDKLERAAGLTPAQAEMAEDEVNKQLHELKTQIQKAVSSE